MSEQMSLEDIPEIEEQDNSAEELDDIQTEEQAEEQLADSEDQVDAEFRKRKELEAKLQKAQEELQKSKGELLNTEKPQEVKLPTPDEWIDDPESAQAKYESYVKYQDDVKAWEEKNKQFQQSKQQVEAEKVTAQVEAFYQRAKSSQIDRVELDKAGDVVANALRASGNQSAAEIASYLMRHENGPQIVKDLSGDAVLMQELAGLSGIDAGAKIESLAAKYKRRTKSNAPPPVSPVRGNPVPKREYGPAGATYE